MNEREAIVAWLREPMWDNMPLWKRLYGAVLFIISPRAVAETFGRFFAMLIERGQHTKGQVDECPGSHHR